LVHIHPDHLHSCLISSKSCKTRKILPVQSMHQTPPCLFRMGFLGIVHTSVACMCVYFDRVIINQHRDHCNA
jgi:hypothetical protein